ncbi:MAG: hypothetical protein A2Y42_04100 [Omnitrophica WOR_2 bacterium GWB2_45_9]|nr:lipoyl domain-containing protein [Candidatus Omnitrophota bacterium]OGX11188.1 MAG: hypothetical protein A2Y42_04100 [Omnitrophica WOR_2 bacterium GWB2_45_9]OGX60755.1 MAG: hypothetical protein A2471_05910 [Omnitrophica WOR_2 bacterium RIFOXYC2_FULL_45_15]HBU08477.1 hypothetical protein [Candidatus Omnitrophota bacterium]
MTKIILPELGEGITKAVVSYWYFQAGQAVKKGEDLVEFTTDKATFNLPSPVSGKLTEILAPEGQNVNVGQAIGNIEE